jgi:DsbC/DsbD-like thiol-disulfide interchange protein
MWRLPALALAALALLAQGSGHLNIAEPQRVTGKRGEAVESKIAATIDPGFHVNSNTPSEDYLIPLKLTWKATGALEAGQVTYPKPSMEKYLDQKLSVFTGKFDIVAHFKIASNAPVGPGAAVGQLKYQACNDRMCFQPKTIEVTVPYAVQ